MSGRLDIFTFIKYTNIYIYPKFADLPLNEWNMRIM